MLIDPRVRGRRRHVATDAAHAGRAVPRGGGRPDRRNSWRYGTPWPLSEDDYLCVYDADAKNRGVYWLDRFGNRELIYRDPAISCLSPIPLRASATCRPVIPVGARSQTAARRHMTPGRHVAAGDRRRDERLRQPISPGRTERPRSKPLRVIQVLPKSTPPPNEPRIGVAQQTNARAVLGTVPVEDRRQCVLRGPGRASRSTSRPSTSGARRPVDAFRDLRPPGRTAHLPGLPRAETRTTATARRNAAGPATRAVDHPARRRGLQPVQLRAARPARAGPPLRRLPPREEGIATGRLASRTSSPSYNNLADKYRLLLPRPTAPSDRRPRRQPHRRPASSAPRPLRS